MDISFLVRGLLIGFSVAAQVGPMCFLCIRRTLALGRTAGLVSGLGIATADALYASVGGFGLTLISAFLITQTFWLRLIGGFFLVYLGFKTVGARPADSAAKGAGSSLFGFYVSTFLLTLTNPLTILSFAAILAGLGLGGTNGNYSLAGLLIVGVFIGSSLWWLVLTTGINLFRTRFTPATLQWVNKVSGLIILSFGIYALWWLL